MEKISKQLAKDLLPNYLFDIVKTRFTRSPLLKPLIFSYYVTLRCNFHCSFCGFARSLETSEELSTEKAIELLRIIKQSSPCIYFTGGGATTQE